MRRVAGEGGGLGGRRSDQRKVASSRNTLNTLGVLVGRVAHRAGRGEASGRDDSNGGAHSVVYVVLLKYALDGRVILVFKRWMEFAEEPRSGAVAL